VIKNSLGIQFEDHNEFCAKQVEKNHEAWRRNHEAVQTPLIASIPNLPHGVARKKLRELAEYHLHTYVWKRTSNPVWSLWKLSTDKFGLWFSGLACFVCWKCCNLGGQRNRRMVRSQVIFLLIHRFFRSWHSMYQKIVQEKIRIRQWNLSEILWLIFSKHNLDVKVTASGFIKQMKHDFDQVGFRNY